MPNWLYNFCFINILVYTHTHSAQGLPKECIIYVRVLRKHWKSKITHCPCMILCSIPIALWHIFWNPKLFFKLTLSWIWTARLEGNRPVRSQFLFKRNLLTVDSACIDWVFVLPRVPQKNSVFEETQPKIICYSQSHRWPQPHNHCHFCCKIKGKTLLGAWIYCIIDPINQPREGSDVMK